MGRRFTLIGCHSKTRVGKKVHIDGQYAQEGVKNETIKRTKTSGTVRGIDAMSNKTEKNAIKCAIASKTSSYSSNQPQNRRFEASKDTKCRCKIVFFETYDGCYYLDHKASSLIHTGHNMIPPESSLRGINFISDQSQALVEKMSTVGVQPSQLSVILNLLEDTDGHFDSASNLVRKCELISNKKIGITHDMSSAEKAMDYLAS